MEYYVSTIFMVSLAGYQTPAYIARAYLYIGNVAEAGPKLRAGSGQTFYAQRPGLKRLLETAWRISPH